MTRDYLRLLGFLAAFGSALIHAAIAPEHYQELPYIGVAFVLGAAFLLAAGLWLLLADWPEAWHLGALVCAGMIIALLASRTVGLPGGYREGWEPEAWWSLALELVFVGCYFARLREVRAGRWKEVHPDEDAAAFQALADERGAGAAGGRRRVQPGQLALELTRRQGVPPAGAGRDRPAAPGREG